MRTPFRVPDPQSSHRKKKGSSPHRVGTPVPRDLESHASRLRRYFLAFLAPFFGAAFFAGFFAAGFLAAFFFAVAMVPTSSLLWVAGGLGISRPFSCLSAYTRISRNQWLGRSIFCVLSYLHTRDVVCQEKNAHFFSLWYFFPWGSSKFGLDPGRKPCVARLIGNGGNRVYESPV